MQKSLDPYPAGTRVRWCWGAHWAEGVVKETFKRRVQRTIKGKHIVRNGEPDNPAYLIEQDNGARVLKRHSEIGLP